MIEMSSEAQARHQAVREFVEQTFPHCRTTEITERVRSHYQLTALAQGASVLARLDIEFDVELLSSDMLKTIECTVIPLEDGRLRITRHTVFFLTPN